MDGWLGKGMGIPEVENPDVFFFLGEFFGDPCSRGFFVFLGYPWKLGTTMGFDMLKTNKHVYSPT